MKMFRWLLCHLLSITLLVSCVFLFLSRDALREDFNRLTGKPLQVAAGDAGSSITNREKDRLQSQAAEKKMRPVVNQTENNTEAIEPSVKTEVAELVVVEPSQAVEPQTVEPQTVEPQMAEPQAVEPQTVEPQTVEPQTVEPQMAEPQMVEPQTVEPQTVEPQTVEPQTVEPQTVEPQTVEPQTVEPQTVEPQTVEPQTVEPQTVEPQTVEPQTVEPQTVEPQTVEPQTVEPQTVEPSIVTPAMSDIQSDTVSAEAPQAESRAKPEKLNNDPWDTVLQGVNEKKLPVSEFGSDMQVRQAVEPTDEAGFPPENYDPEFSSTDTTDKTGSAGGSDIYRNMATGNQPVEQGYATQQSLQDEASSQGPESPQGVMDIDQFEDKTKYFSALEKARRLHWDGNTVPAQAEFERLMFEYPAMPEAAADLGNLLLQQGNREGAIWAYQNAIPRYLNLQREQEAINLTRFVSQYDPAIAESLQKKYW